LGEGRGRLITQSVRIRVIELVSEACNGGARKRCACDLLGISMRTLERWEQENGLLDKRKDADKIIANKLTIEEREVILAIANSKEYRDLPACKIVPMLADKGLYIASESSFYRVLREENQLTHRQSSRPAKHRRPRPYIATGPNQVWSWDITYLPSQVRGMHYYLCMIMDIFSRKIIAWSIHHVESSDYAAHLVKQACIDENVDRNQLVLHSDNGAPMKGATMLAMLETLGVVPSFSRPSVSDDNPYSEALFKTLKYHPTFPLIEKFSTIEFARCWCEKFVAWYNTQHLHSKLKFITPEQRHTGDDVEIMMNRHRVYQEAKKWRPERWSRDTRNWTLPASVLLNQHRKLRDSDRGWVEESRLAA